MIDRDRYLSKIRPMYDSNIIKAITGPRRSGKSVILRKIYNDLPSDPEHKIYIDYENMDNDPLSNAEALHDYLKKKMTDGSKYYILLDEVQNVEGFEKVLASIRNMHDCSI